MTLIHGDPNPGNILVPKVGEQPALSASKGPLFLIDQQPFDWNEFRYGLISHALTAFDDLNCEALL
jgi:predicted unusual protein kinase regulating ubiquinone biosynthesis (AarF/ABC1/UbiB family)